jgi:hypothetical protein
MTAPAFASGGDDLIGLGVAEREVGVTRQTLLREILLGHLPGVRFTERNRLRFVVSRAALRKWAEARVSPARTAS